MSNMYDDAKTWNPFKGCRFDCAYCKPSFQAQAKRQKHNCTLCYSYIPHWHMERIDKIPNAKIVFVCGNGDIAFCHKKGLRLIINKIRENSEKHPGKTFYLQTKNPACLKPFCHDFPHSIVLVTTLETNRDEGYEQISKAPKPSTRYIDFHYIKYPRKVVSIEPIMDFDLKEFADWIIRINPEYVWMGFNSRPKQVQLPEPGPVKTRQMIEVLSDAGIEIKFKHMRYMA